MNPRRCSIVVPAYNEAENIPHLVEDILGSYPGFELVLVDDNSSDETFKICERYAKKHDNIVCVSRACGQNGMGYALCEGTEKACGEYVFWVMADRSDDLSAIGKMVFLLDDGFDMVIASRYMRGGSKGDLECHKAMYGAVYSRLAGAIFGLPVQDITNAFRGFRKTAYNDMKRLSGTFSISPEFAIRAHLAGYMIGQVPTTYFNRRAGQAKFNLIRMGIEYVSLFMLRFKRPDVGGKSG